MQLYLLKLCGLLKNVEALNVSADVYDSLTFHELPRRPPLRIFSFQLSSNNMGEENVSKLVTIYVVQWNRYIVKTLNRGVQKKHLKISHLIK